MREPTELEPAVRGVLLAGGVQLLFLDRIPTHAALHESVEWAKRNVRQGAAGLVNAVLRRIASARASEDGTERVIRPAWSGQRDELPLADGRALVLAAELLPTDPIERASICTGVDRGMISRWASRFGQDEAIRLAMHALANAPTVLNALYARERSTPPHCRVHGTEGFFIYEGPHRDLAALTAPGTLLWVQDTASAEAVRSVSHLTPRVIADLCAGRGTKTRQLAAQFPNAEIVASDTDAARLADLRRVLGGNQRVRAVPPRELEGSLRGRADLILLDVPCSNTGVLARRTEARLRGGRHQLERLTAIQREIVRNSLAHLAPGGHVLYSTCSLEREENDGVVEWATSKLGLTKVAGSLTLPRGLPGENAAGYRDGSFWTLLRARD